MSEPIPQGIEVLVKKASVDPLFRALLLDRPEAAVAEIGLELGPAEAMMLRSVPREQLAAVIARTSVPEEHRRTFLGQAAAAMLAALGIATGTGCGQTETKGARPDRPPERGIRPDLPPPQAPEETPRPPAKDIPPVRPPPRE
jgi:hypothetical protein